MATQTIDDLPTPALILDRAILRRNLKVQGLYVGSTQMFEAMNRAIEANGLKPVIDKVFPFAEAKAAYQHLKSQKHFGKIVISHA